MKESVSSKYELLNRIDEKIIFEPLQRIQIRRIAELQIERLSNRLRDHQVELEVSEAAREAIAAQGYDPRYGARPLKRVIQQKIENPLATEMLKGDIGEGIQIKVGFHDDEFTFDRIPQREREAVEA
jgi:ATP-dependent Clp protease ATP-binding subunit ClpA